MLAFQKCYILFIPLTFQHNHPLYLTIPIDQPYPSSRYKKYFIRDYLWEGPADWSQLTLSPDTCAAASCRRENEFRSSTDCNWYLTRDRIENRFRQSFWRETAALNFFVIDLYVNRFNGSRLNCVWSMEWFYLGVTFLWKEKCLDLKFNRFFFWDYSSSVVSAEFLYHAAVW